MLKLNQRLQKAHAEERKFGMAFYSGKIATTKRQLKANTDALASAPSENARKVLAGRIVTLKGDLAAYEGYYGKVARG